MAGPDHYSTHELWELIASIYDCAIDPQRWTATCRHIAKLCDSTAGGICVHDLVHARNDQSFVFGYSPTCQKALAEAYAESPIARSDMAADLGHVTALSMSPHYSPDSSFFHDVLEPNGLLDIIWFPALRTGGRMASLHASRVATALPYQQQDIRFFKELAPHVCRAMAISNVLQIQTVRSDLLEETLDGLAAGVFLTAPNGQVVYMNATAERQVRAGDSIHVVDQRICPVDTVARAALSEAIQLARDGDAVQLSGQSLAIPNGKGGGYVATILPLGQGLRREVLASFAACVAVFTQDPASAPLMPAQAFARLHGLTDGELRVLLALAQGLGGMEVADKLGISEPTIRTHLQHIYAKTGTSKQGDLLRLLHQSTPPIRMDGAKR